jgi:membrane-associated phospholipid phosphatase
LLVALSLLIALMGPSRIYLGQHWFSDVMGAYLFGSLWLALTIRFYRWGKRRYFVHQPVAPAAPAASEAGTA